MVQTSFLKFTQTGKNQITSEETRHEESITNNAFITLYILVGLGPFISLFLFVSALKCCNKSKSRKTNDERQTGSDNDKHSVLSNQIRSINQQDYDSSSDVCTTVHFYRPFQNAYEEINEVSELHPSNISNLLDGYERPTNLSRDTLHWINNAPIEENEQEFNVASQSYLTPLHVEEIA